MSLTLNSFNNNSIYSLFSNNTGANSAFGGLETSLTSLSQIKSGTYAKLVKSYYQKYDSEGNLKADGASSKVKGDKGNLNEIRKDSSSLSQAADKLLGRGSKLWDKVETKAEDGTITKDYDRDAIYGAIDNFAKAYNDLVDSGQKAESTGLLSQVASMVTISNKTATTLGKAGISIDKDNHLKVDEDFLKNKANITYVKDLFNGTGSFAYQVASKASMANSYASTDLSKLTGKKSYTSSGGFSLSSDDIVRKFDQQT